MSSKSNQKVYAYLKETADLGGLDKDLTAHITRQSYATTVTLDNDVLMESVSKMLGILKLPKLDLCQNDKQDFKSGHGITMKY